MPRWPAGAAADAASRGPTSTDFTPAFRVDSGSGGTDSDYRAMICQAAASGEFRHSRRPPLAARAAAASRCRAFFLCQWRDHAAGCCRNLKMLPQTERLGASRAFAAAAAAAVPESCAWSESEALAGLQEYPAAADSKAHSESNPLVPGPEVVRLGCRGGA